MTKPGLAEAQQAIAAASGRYRVPSETRPELSYVVQVTNGRGVCNCLGFESAARKGNVCKHVKAILAWEGNEAMTTDTAETKAVAVRKMPVDVAVRQASPTLPSMSEMSVMKFIAESIITTAGKLIPENIKSEAEALAIMLAGHELGIPPMAAFREIYIVKGRTVPSYRVLAGLVLNGDPGATLTWVERNAERACVQLRRSNGMGVEVEYTIEDAKRAGVSWKNRDGSPSVWSLYTTDMLAKSALTRACRLGGADLITGIGASTKHAPAVMEAFEEIEEAPIEPLRVTVLPPEPSREEQMVAAQHQTAAPDAKPEGPTVAQQIRSRLGQMSEDVKTRVIAAIDTMSPASIAKGAAHFTLSKLTEAEQLAALDMCKLALGEAVLGSEQEPLPPEPDDQPFDATLAAE